MNKYWKRFSIVLNASLDSVALIKGRIMWNVDLCWCQNISQQQQMSNVRWNGLHILHFTIMSVHANISHLPSQLNHVFQFASLKGSSFIFSVLIYEVFNSLWQMYLKEVHKFFYSTLKIKVCVCLVLRVSDLMLRLKDSCGNWIFHWGERSMCFESLRSSEIWQKTQLENLEMKVLWAGLPSSLWPRWCFRVLLILLPQSYLLTDQYLYEIYTFNSVVPFQRPLTDFLLSKIKGRNFE